LPLWTTVSGLLVATAGGNGTAEKGCVVALRAGPLICGRPRNEPIVRLPALLPFAYDILIA
jgi:hypothetical protein